ncbi:hypothetical protein [Synechococcus sp. CS-603]|uniref:hypothetical protein n=1 Tax=Synechococcus sp. CS-603 TaxID=2847981 RepID=UPI00223ACF85|nr:hypothetical protein [Synechococcus sp. CS-603]MCT0201872.1 hypothetical protein [Synechococcus sp. CS-603]
MKLFYDQDQLQVALFTSGDGWIQNLPAMQVFMTSPDGFPYEAIIPIDQFKGSVEFQPAFLATFSGPIELVAQPKSVNLNHYVLRISKKTGLPAEQVRTVCLDLLRGLVRLSETGTRFVSPVAFAVPGSDPAGQSPTGQPLPASNYLRFEARAKP